jgi:hypothetical protein
VIEVRGMTGKNKQKEVFNNLPEHGYSETATKAIKQWYNIK